MKKDRKQIQKEYRERNREQLREKNRLYKEQNKDIIKEKNKIYKEQNKDIIKEKNKIYKEQNKERDKKYRELNKERINLKKKEYYLNNKSKIKDYNKIYKLNRMKVDPLFLLKRKIYNIIYKAVKHKYSKRKTTLEILGCSYEQFKLHLENHFEPWMNWGNYGKYNGVPNYGWDIDHVIPQSSAETEQDVIKLNHYTNLKPLCSYVNRYVKKENH
jgi:hypothetical protein